LSRITLPKLKQEQQQDDMADASAESTFNMEEFFKTVGEVRSLIDNISGQAEKVEGLQAAILSTPTPDKKKKDTVELLNNEIKRNGNLVRARLKSMQDNLAVDEDRKGASVVQRIQKNQHSDLTRCFAEALRGHHTAQISFREKCKAQIQRQLEIVDKVTTDEELEEMLHRDNLSIFISDINSGALIVSRALSEIESRHQDIIRLESSIRELHDIFADTAVLLEIQGDLINNIEKNVTSAAEYVDASKAQTCEAIAYKKNPYKISSLPSFFRPFKR
uniref:t-SNARE coiled-coil homology domain-containing protein n=2 Tax=Gasterosteus aculeatus TaxID=69293 RepID=G3Q0H2_GASAC